MKGKHDIRPETFELNEHGRFAILFMGVGLDGNLFKRYQPLLAVFFYTLTQISNTPSLRMYSRKIR